MKTKCSRRMDFSLDQPRRVALHCSQRSRSRTRARFSVRVADTARTICWIAFTSRERRQRSYAVSVISHRYTPIYGRNFAGSRLYGPMVAAGLDHGADAPEGYDSGELHAGAHRIETRLVHRSQRRVNQGRFKRRHTSRRLPESGRNDDRNSVGTRYTRRDSDSRRSRHEAVAGGQSLDAPEASRKIPWNCRYRPRRFSGEQSRRREPRP